MREYSYDYTVRLLLTLGFTNLGEIDECISGYDDDEVSRAVYGTRLGQLSRFEFVLLVSMGDDFVAAHPWVSKDDPRYARYLLSTLIGFTKMGIAIGSFKPANYVGRRLTPSELADIRAHAGSGTTTLGSPATPDEPSSTVGRAEDSS